jgi:type IV secretory pathway VirB2 component (pilin)
VNSKTLAYVVVAAVLLIPLAAHAQLVGGAPETALTTLVTWLSGPFIRPVLAIGFIVAGILMMVGRHTFEGLVFALIGGTIAVGAQNLSSLMTGG